MTKHANTFAKHIRSSLSYDAETGVLTRLTNSYRRNNAGTRADYVNFNGYCEVSLNGQRFLAHRLIWLIMYGYLPTKDIDHINGVKHDNRLVNLREVPHIQNSHNRAGRANRDSKSGILGVSWCNTKRKWVASITIAGKQKMLGRYETIAEAKTVYELAKATVFNQHAF